MYTAIINFDPSHDYCWNEYILYHNTYQMQIVGKLLHMLKFRNNLSACNTDVINTE